MAQQQAHCTSNIVFNSHVFHSKSIDLPIPKILLLKFDLENPRSRSWVRSKFKVITWVQHPNDSHPFGSMSIHLFLWYLPRIWPSVTDMQLYYHARYPTNDWHLAYMFSLVYFSVEVCQEGVFPHSVSTRRDPCVRVYAPLTLAPPSRKNKNKIKQGVTQLSTWTKRGGIWTDAWVCLHYCVVIWVAWWSNSHLYCTVHGVCHRQNTLWP